MGFESFLFTVHCVHYSSVPVDLLGARKKTSEIMTKSKAAFYVERIFFHSICSEQILNLVKLSEDSFPDLNTVYIRDQVPDYFNVTKPKFTNVLTEDNLQ